MKPSLHPRDAPEIENRIRRTDRKKDDESQRANMATKAPFAGPKFSPHEANNDDKDDENEQNVDPSRGILGREIESQSEFKKLKHFRGW